MGFFSLCVNIEAILTQEVSNCCHLDHRQRQPLHSILQTDPNGTFAYSFETIGLAAGPQGATVQYECVQYI